MKGKLFFHVSTYQSSSWNLHMDDLFDKTFYAAFTNFHIFILKRTPEFLPREEINTCSKKLINSVHKIFIFIVTHFRWKKYITFYLCSLTILDLNIEAQCILECRHLIYCIWLLRLFRFYYYTFGEF